MIPPIKNTLWQPSDWANHPLATKLDEYIVEELDFREGPDLSREAIGLELLETGNIVLKSMVWDDLEAQCYRYVRQKWLDPRPPDIGFSSQFLEALHTSALEELSKPGLNLKDKPMRINHLAALRVIARIPQASAMEAYLAAINTEKPGSEFYYLLANAIVDCIDPTQHRKFHHQLFPLFWEMIEKNYDEELLGLLEKELITIVLYSNANYFDLLGAEGLFSLIIPEGLPHFARYFREVKGMYPLQKQHLMQQGLCSEFPEVQAYFIDFIPEFLAIMQEETKDDYRAQASIDEKKYKVLQGFYHRKPEVVDILFEREPAYEGSQKINVIHRIFSYADEFNMPQLYDLAIEAFKHPNANTAFRKDYYYNMTTKAFPYFRDVLLLYLEEKYAQQKEMAKSVKSLLTKSDEIKKIEFYINILESELNKFEPTPETDFDEGLPIV